MSGRSEPGARLLALAIAVGVCVAEGAAPEYSLDELRSRSGSYAQSVREYLGEAGEDQTYLADDRDRLAVAEDFYRRGDPAKAAEVLRPEVSFQRRVNDPAVIDLHLRILLALGKHREAVDWLIGQKSADIQTPYTRFNLAVALMRLGKEPEAVTVLYRLGRMRVRDDEARALRDQANLALGWHFLARDLGGNAKAAFRQIPLHGPQSNAALLGIGWAELAPQGRRQYRDYVGDEASPFDVKDLSPGVARTLAERRLLEPDLALLVNPAVLPSYPMAQLSAAEKTALGRAVLFWQELQRRDEHDPFVWESWVAFPYALEKAGLYDQAIEHYRAAIARLESLEQSLNAEAARGERLAAEVLAGMDIRNSPDGQRALLLSATAASAPWAAEWIAGRQAQVILNDLLEARQGRDRIEALSREVASTNTAHATRKDAERLQREAETLVRLWTDFTHGREQAFAGALGAQLELRLGLLRRYRQSAHIALARLQDPDMPRTAPPADPETRASFWQRLRVFTLGR